MKNSYSIRRLHVQDWRTLRNAVLVNTSSNLSLFDLHDRSRSKNQLDWQSDIRSGSYFSLNTAVGGMEMKAGLAGFENVELRIFLLKPEWRKTQTKKAFCNRLAAEGLSVDCEDYVYFKS